MRAGARTLQLRGPRHGTDLRALAALVGVFVLIALAATQPALSHDTVQRVRKDAQALFVLDTSRSMSAASGPSALTRLARAKQAATRLRAAIPDVESGIATLTDRVLPDLLPVADLASFDATLERSVGIEEPPPSSVSVRATSFTALDAIPGSSFFATSAKRRAIVLLTDGEQPVSIPAELGRALAGRIGLVVIRFWRAWASPSSGRRAARDRVPARPAAPASRRARRRRPAGAFDEGNLGPAAAKLRSSSAPAPPRQSSDAHSGRPRSPRSSRSPRSRRLRCSCGAERRTIDPSMIRGLRTSKALVLLVLAVLVGVALTSATAATNASGPNVGWGGFGNTPNENRHSPLTIINTSNVANLGRVVTVDFHAIDAASAAASSRSRSRRTERCT